MGMNPTKNSWKVVTIGTLLISIEKKLIFIVQIIFLCQPAAARQVLLVDATRVHLNIEQSRDKEMSKGKVWAS